jgi:hypothetical protein
VGCRGIIHNHDRSQDWSGRNRTEVNIAASSTPQDSHLAEPITTPPARNVRTGSDGKMTDQGMPWKPQGT